MAGDQGNGKKLFGDFSQEKLDSFIKDQLGIDDPEEFQNQMRVFGPPGPSTHDVWHDIFYSLNWSISNINEENKRLKPCLTLHSHKLNGDIPVLIENYSFQPFDNGDNLATEAKSALMNLNAPVALLLFRSLSYKNVGDTYYTFAGYVSREGNLHPFAITHRMNSVDDILNQIDSGFTFSKPTTEWGEDHPSLALAFAKMCAGLDPNKPQEHVVLGQGEWKFVVCQPDVLDGIEMLEGLNEMMSEMKKGFH